MKVVLFCGGLGIRMRSQPSRVPKPMERIGGKPILWHLMRYYAHHGHREFVLCLGAGSDVIERYFARSSEPASVESSRPAGGAAVRLRTRDTGEWVIKLVPTGIHAKIGQRLKAVQPYLSDEEMFLANYTDGLSDLSLPEYVNWFRRRGKVAALVCVQPTSSFHFISLGREDLVDDIQHQGHLRQWVNGGFFVFRREIFDYIEPDEDLVEAPFRRLVALGQLVGYTHEGFWACMDTPSDKRALQEMDGEGRAPWKVWTRASEDSERPSGGPVGGVKEPRLSAYGSNPL